MAVTLWALFNWAWSACPLEDSPQPHRIFLRLTTSSAPHASSVLSSPNNNQAASGGEEGAGARRPGGEATPHGRSATKWRGLGRMAARGRGKATRKRQRGLGPTMGHWSTLATSLYLKFRPAFTPACSNTLTVV